MIKCEQLTFWHQIKNIQALLWSQYSLSIICSPTYLLPSSYMYPNFVHACCNNISAWRGKVTHYCDVFILECTHMFWDKTVKCKCQQPYIKRLCLICYHIMALCHFLPQCVYHHISTESYLSASMNLMTNL